MKYVLAIAILGTVGYAQEAAKPACNAATHGQYWPEAANSDAALVRALTQSGDLQRCVRGSWKYKWEYVSVNIHNLTHGKDVKPEPAKAAAADAKATDPKQQ